MFEVSFRINYDTYYCNLSEKYPSLKLFLWSDKENDVIEIASENPDDFKQIISDIKNRYPDEVIEESIENQKACLIIRNCCCSTENSYINYISSLSILNLYPVVLETGWWYHRAIFLRHEDFDQLIERFKENKITVEILNKGNYDGYISNHFAVTTETLFHRLTQKQVEAVLDAYKYGYFQYPRQHDLGSIAEKVDTPRTTFQNHLKKAENKIISSLAPYLQLYKHTTR